MIDRSETWEPGDPIYRGRQFGYQGFLYNFRDIPDDLPEDTCHCPDAATWPEPRRNSSMYYDPLAQFINGLRVWVTGLVMASLERGPSND